MIRMKSLCALLLALLLSLSVLSACSQSNTTDAPESLPETEDASKGNENTESTAPNVSKEESPAQSGVSEDSKTSPSPEEPLPINKTNALEKLKAGYNATMSANAVRLTGSVSHYQAEKGKGDTVTYPLEFASCKDANGQFTALLTYGESSGTVERYYTGNKVYEKRTSKEDNTSSIGTGEGESELTISTTVMQILSSGLSITSYENLFTRFCATEYDIDLEDGLYVLSFYGTYTDLARICMEDEGFAKFEEQDFESDFDSTSGEMLLYLTEDGYFAGMEAKMAAQSSERSLSSTIKYSFSDFNGNVTVSAPDWVSSAN